MSGQIHDLFYPMLAMFLWTFLILLRNVQVRVGAVLKGQLTNEYFELFRGAEPSDIVLKTQNHLRNLMEIPPLFYIVALAIMLTGKTDPMFLTLSWSYVAFRVGHGLVHLTINKVPVRFLFFILSNLALLVMWVRLGALL
ncbi:MAG TPA: MAPEG family protein [Candidatus Binatia bacterium]|nr:MAPEG family protein [Candidatus Binatia bacterium]